VRVFVDSDVLIEVSRGRDEDLVSRWLSLSRSDNTIMYSPVTAAELWAGARPREHEAITNVFGALLCVALDYETGRLAGDYLRQYGKSHGVELGDALIGAAAHLNGAELWTRNRKRYPMPELSFF
jgi:predicted nucleic acid-binding protein